MASAPTNLSEVVEHSRALITGLQARGGAYPASPRFPAYQGYCWFRDGAFTADGASAVGEVDSASAFFDWCAAVILRSRRRIEWVVAAEQAGAPVPGEAMLPARYTMAGGWGGDDWWNFQLDGYGTWLWAVVAHARRHGLDPERWASAVALTADYLAASWRRPCFDWWEENHDQVHVSTLGCIAAGLRAAADAGLLDGRREAAARDALAGIGELLHVRGTVDGHLTKWLGNPAVDGSLTALVAPLGLVAADSPVGRATVAAVAADLLVEGGVHRFRADTFYGGGRWPLLTCFLGLARNAAGDRDCALECLHWAVATATPDLDLPEQVDGGRLLAPRRKQEWLDRWGPVATPLLWSHAMVLRLAADLDLVGPRADP